MAQICDLEILRSALNDRRSSFSTATEDVTLFLLEFTTNHLNEVKDWVLSWSPGAVAMAPAALVAKVKEGLKGALDSYGQ